ncbi:MAG: hypothetical protein HOV80_23635 [Polyangiaceae bacterium]|nr:hypothetical protein [Polyangiaceae bacterium]
MKPEDEWESWASDYRSAKAPPPDVAAIVDAARRGTWGWAGKMTIDVAAHTFGFVVFALLCVKVPAVWPFAAIVMPGFALSLANSLHARKGTYAAAAESTASYVELEWRRKRGELRIHRFGRVLLGVFVVGFSIWLPFFLAGGNGRPDLGMPFLIARLIFAVATFIGTFFYLNYKVRKTAEELERIERVRSSLRDDAEAVAI